MFAGFEGPPFQQQQQLSRHDGVFQKAFWSAQGQPAGYELGGRDFLQVGWNWAGSGGSGIPDFQDAPNFYGPPMPIAYRYSDRPRVFKSPPLDGRGNYAFGGNSARFYNALPAIRVQAPEEFGARANFEVAGHGGECAALPFQRGLGALKLATEESWQVTRESINPVLTQVNERVGCPLPVNSDCSIFWLIDCPSKDSLLCDQVNE